MLMCFSLEKMRMCVVSKIYVFLLSHYMYYNGTCGNACFIHVLLDKKETMCIAMSF